MQFIEKSSYFFIFNIERWNHLHQKGQNEKICQVYLGATIRPQSTRQLSIPRHSVLRINSSRKSWFLLTDVPRTAGIRLDVTHFFSPSEMKRILFNALTNASLTHAVGFSKDSFPWRTRLGKLESDWTAHLYHNFLPAFQVQKKTNT
jgi:hypothetical protein